MIQIYIYSREAIQAIKPHTDAPHLIISINSSEENAREVRLPRSEMTIGVHSVVFGDVDRDEEGKVPAMTVDQADGIWKFVDDNLPNITRILVHCDGGRSRSPGVGAALGAMLNQDDKEFFNRYTPNMHVYRTMINTFVDKFDTKVSDEDQNLLLKKPT